MNVKATVLSLALVGLLAVPLCSRADGGGGNESGHGLVGSLMPQTGTLTPSGDFAGSLSDPNPVRLGDLTPSSRNSTKSIKSLGSITSNDDPIGGGVPGPTGVPATPEPGTLALLVGGISGGLLVMRRRKK